MADRTEELTLSDGRVVSVEITERPRLSIRIRVKGVPTPPDVIAELEGEAFLVFSLPAARKNGGNDPPGAPPDLLTF